MGINQGVLWPVGLFFFESLERITKKNVPDNSVCQAVCMRRKGTL